VISRRKDVGAGHVAFLHQLAHADIHVVRNPGAPHRGDAAFERRTQLGQRGNVHVGIDQAWHDIPVVQVDHASAGRRRAGGDGLNGGPADHDGRLGNNGAGANVDDRGIGQRQDVLGSLPEHGCRRSGHQAKTQK
jgi:hypothetical protein